MCVGRSRGRGVVHDVGAGAPCGIENDTPRGIYILAAAGITSSYGVEVFRLFTYDAQRGMLKHA